MGSGESDRAALAAVSDVCYSLQPTDLTRSYKVAAVLSDIAFQRGALTTCFKQHKNRSDNNMNPEIWSELQRLSVDLDTLKAMDPSGIWCSKDITVTYIYPT